MIKEDFNFSGEKMRSKQTGKLMSVIFIDPKKSEETKPYKDEIKRFGALWDDKKYRWYWILSNDPEKRQKQMDTMINPCIDFLNSVENKGKSTRTADTIKGDVQTLIQQIDKVINTKIENAGGVDVIMSADDLKAKLIEFKKQLLTATSDEEFKERFAPMLKQVGGTNGYPYSPLNTLLIRIQDPQATMVLSKTRWTKLNHVVLTGGRNNLTKAIWLWVPIPIDGSTEEIKKEFLIEVGKSDVSELTPEENAQLKERLKKNSSVYYQLMPNFYDIRFTKVRPGHKDLVKGAGNKLVNTKNGNEHGDLQWYDEDSPATEETEKIYDAIIKMISTSGLQLNFVDDLNGARGVSKGGIIDILQTAPKNIGTCQTMIHEFSHELFHHMNLKNKNIIPWGKYYIGREQGRNIIEQQAELSSWIVMRFLGYDMATNINYLGNWGINEENAVEVFDQVADAANRITVSLNQILANQSETETLNESMIPGRLTGLDVASLLGKQFVQMYQIGKEKKEEMLQEEKRKINESFAKICGIEL